MSPCAVFQRWTLCNRDERGVGKVGIPPVLSELARRGVSKVRVAELAASEGGARGCLAHAN